MFNFLWNNKNDKVKRKCIEQNYDKGGLRNVDLQNFMNAFKITWL